MKADSDYYIYFQALQFRYAIGIGSVRKAPVFRLCLNLYRLFHFLN